MRFGPTGTFAGFDPFPVLMNQVLRMNVDPAQGIVAHHGEHEGHWQRFSMMVAHDLKEPLLNVASCAGMLATDTTLASEEREQMLHGLKLSADRLTALVNEMLEFARLGGEQQIERVDVNKLTEEIKSDLRCLLRRTGAQLSIGAMPVMQAGKIGLRVILGNLIENAIKYGRAEEAVKVSLNAERTASGWLFSVTDNGMGIAPENRSSVFDPFRRFTLQGEGVGMGLSHVVRMVQEHKGWIDLDSEVGVGSTFSVFLPDQQEQPS